MDEKKTEKAEAPKEAITPQEKSVIEQATEINKELKENIAKREVQIVQEQQIAASKLLAGRGEAGMEVQKREESPKEYKDRIMKGG